MSRESDKSRTAPKPPGSMASTKAIRQAVKDGRLVTAMMPWGESISGYVCGADDFHWVLVLANGDTVLVHKSTPAVSISKTRTYQTEPEEARTMIEEATSSFRAFVLRADSTLRAVVNT